MAKHSQYLQIEEITGIPVHELCYEGLDFAAVNVVIFQELIY